MGVNSEGKIYLSAVLNPESIREMGSQIETAAEQVSKNVKLKIGFDNKNIKEAAEQSINNINKLFSKGSFGKLKINFDGVLPQFKDYLEDSNIDDLSKLDAITSFEETLKRLRHFSKIDSSFLEGLDANQLKSFINEMNLLYDLIDKVDSKTQTALVKGFWKGNGFDIKEISALQDFINNEGIEALGVLGDSDFLLSKIEDYYNQYLNAYSKSAEKAALEMAIKFKTAYEASTGIFLQDSRLGESFTDQLMDTFFEEFEEDPTKIEELENYAINLIQRFQSFLDEQGINIDLSKIRSRTNEVLKESFERDVDKKEMPSTEDLVTKTVNIGMSENASPAFSQERKEVELLKEAVDEVTEAINNKTQSLVNEGATMKTVVDSEITKLDELKLKLNSLYKRDNSTAQLTVSEEPVDESIPNTDFANEIEEQAKKTVAEAQKVGDSISPVPMPLELKPEIKLSEHENNDIPIELSESMSFDTTTGLKEGIEKTVEQEEKLKQTTKETTDALKEQKETIDNLNNKQINESQNTNLQMGFSDEDISLFIERLSNIYELLNNIAISLGALDDNSDIPSLIQSISSMSVALGDVKQLIDELNNKDFNLNFQLNQSKANPMIEEGKKNRKIINEFEQQYEELQELFENEVSFTYGSGRTVAGIPAIRASLLAEGRNNEAEKLGKLLFEQLKIAQDTSKNNPERIDAYKKILTPLRQYAEEMDFDLNKELTSNIDPTQLIQQSENQLQEVLNPMMGLRNIFTDLKASIDASLGSIKAEGNQFSFLSGSAEEAAEAKRKFVEANKDVLQSIVASMPKIEEEAKALEKVETPQSQAKTTKGTKTQEESSKPKGRKGYFDFEAMPNDLIEQRYAEISPFPITPKGISLATDRLNDEVHTAMDSVELLEELHTAWDRSQQEIKDIIYDSTIENMQEEYAESQRPIYDFEPDYEDLARQAQEAREYYEEQISNDFEIKAEAKLDLVQDETGQLSLFDDVLPEKNWGQEIIQVTDDISKSAIKGQISLQDLEEAEQKVTAQYAKLRSNKDFIQGEDVSEKFLETYEGISTEKIQELFKTLQELKQVKASLQDSFDEKGNLIGDPLQVEDTYNTYIKLIDVVKRLKLDISGQYSEETVALKLKQDTEKAEKELEQLKTTIEQTFAKISSSKEFIQGKDLNANYLKQFGDKDSTKNLDKIKESFQQLENIKFQLKLAFSDEGKLFGDPTQTQLLLDRYDYLTKKIERLKLIIESPNSGENILKEIIKDEEKTAAETEKLTGVLEKAYSKLISPEKITASTEKFLQPYFDLSITETSDQMINAVERIQNLSKEISSSFNEQGELIGNPRKVQELIIEYNSLIKQIDILKQKISSPLSEENVALQMAKDADKAKKELEKLKAEVDKFFENRKNDVVRSTAEQVISAYGTTNEEGKLLSVRSSFFDDNPNYQGLIEQQNYVIALAKALEKYKIAVENLKKTRESDIIKVEDLKEANNQVELLEDKIKQLETIIKKVGKGKTNATDKNINDLRTKIQSILENNSDLPEDAAERLKDYLEELESGASISKAAYDSMTADIKQFSAEQKKSFSVWDMMTMKIKEGIAFLATKFSFYQIFNQFRQGAQVIRQFDDALTEMMKVSDESRKTLEAYQKTTFDTADAIGSNALQIQNSTADFMRLGESLTEAVESAKTANVLMNVSEFQSIDEATKSLIAMSAAYDDLSKAQIIDKLNEVGNNYSISTSGAAEALQASASALKTAGNDMDEALALVTAGNQIVQDVSKAGNGLRTIALRLTGTKSAKEELEEMGEDTDSLITTQSKLRDTIKEATAVASNQFKGFDILDDNGNYKSTYEIMLGIAQIYQEIVDTDKELGRNNANLLLETVAGKTRANIAASIFQSPDVLKSAYESSQNADNSAMRENDKYLQSISGHLSQLTNQWQEMWANAANREIINFFIDLGKVLLQIIDLFGVLPSTIIGVVGYLTLIKDASEDKSIIKAIGTWIESLTQLENKTGKVVSKIVSVGSEIKTIFSSAVIPAAMSLGTAVALIGVAANAFGEYQRRIKQELLDGAKKTSEEWQSQKQSLSDYASQYEELKTKLDTGNLSEQETLKVKQQIYDIQKQITEQYGENTSKIDLVNGKLQDQLDIISKISQIEADRTWQSQNYQKGFEIAEEAMTSEGSFAINSFDPDYSTKQNEALSKIIEKYVQSNSVETDELGEIADTYFITGNVQEREKIIRAMIKQIEDLRKHYSNTRGTAEGDAFFEQSQIYLDELTRGLDIIDTINKENKDIWLSGLNVQLNREGKGSTFLDYQSAVSNLESAYASGNTKQIQEAREAYEEAIKAKNEFLKVPENNKYLALFDNINTSIIDTKNKTEDSTEAIKEALQMDKEISHFDEYRQQKKQADEYIRDSLEVVKQVGNVDNTNRPFIFWDSKEAEKQKEALESWGESVDDIIGSYSTVYGGSEEFDGVEIAFTPIINDGTGKGKLLTKETLYKYINTLIDNAGEGWTNEELFALDAKGLTIDGQQISNVLAAIDDSMSNVGLTAEEVGEKMHDWQSQSIGYIANYQNEWKEAIKQGKSFEEYMADQEKDLKDVTKATGRYTKEDKRLYQVLKRVIDLDIDRVEAEQAFDENANGSQIYRVALEDLMNALGYTIEDSGLMIDMLVANGVIYGDVSDATLSASDAYNQFSQEVATAIENVSKLNAILTESVSGAGISTQNIDAFKEMFGDDYIYALERSANGYHINAEKLQTLTDKQKALMNADFQNTLDAQYDALKRCNDEIIKANSEQGDTSGLLAQRQGILQRIQDTQDLMMAYQASTSAYQTWINAQSNGNEYDMYDKIASGYDTVKDLIDRGWSGDDTVRSYLDLIYGDSFDAFTASGEKCVEMFDNLDKKIEGTSFSIKDFFQMDENGKLTSNGIFNFFDAVKEKQDELDKNWLTLDENGNITDYNFGFGRDREVAEALGLDVELLQSILRAAVSAGFELNLDQPMWAMDELGEKAVKAQEELGAFNDIDFEELYNNLDDENAYETISGHINEVYDYIQKIEDSDLSPELKTQQIEQAQDMLSYLVALEREAANRSEIDLKATVVGSAKEELDKLIDETDELPDALKQYNWEEITDKEGLQKARNYIAAEIEGGRIDSSSAEAFLSILDQALDELNLIDEYEANPTFEGNTVGAFNDVKQAREELEKYIADAQQLEKDYDIKFNFAEDENVKKYLSIIYGEGTPEILASLDINSSKTPEEIIEMLESGERDVDILLKGDTTQLEEDIEEATDNSNVSVNTSENVTHTETQINREENYSSTTLDINDDAYNQKLASDKESMEAMSGEGIVINVDANTEPAKEKQAEVLQGNQEIENTPAEAELKADNSQANNAIDESTRKIYSYDGTTGWGYIRVDTGDTESTVSRIAKAIRDIPSYKSTTIETIEKHTTGANGTAHAYGTAFVRGSAYAGGKWGLPKNQTALTGELGTEIVVRDGNWFTVGDDGAEFVNLKRGDIVFNHEQAKELLENGYVTSNKGRGHLVGFANGTAYSSGSTSGATRARVKTSSVGSKSSSKSSGGSGSSSSGSGNSGRGNNNSSSKDAKDTKNTLDEVEILIARIERQISNLDKTISNTYTAWSKRNEAIVSNLKNVSAEIKKQEAAYTTYINKANSVGLSATWKNRIQNGAYRIDDVKDSDLWDKINEYKQWYEKALACKDAVIDLKQKEGELYKQRFDNEQTYYEEVIANTQHAIDLVEAFNDQLSEAGRLGSVLNVRQQIALERKRLTQLTDEYNSLIKQRDNAVSSGKITKGSETWYEMQQSINDVSESIAEANTNLITFANNIRDINFDRWDKVHNAIGGVVNELEFFYDLLNPDEMFDEQGSITDQGITGFALLAQEYDTYFKEVQRYQDEINETNRLMAEAEYDQNLVDKLKELKEGQQDAAANAKKMKESMVDLTEDGIKKQIDYVKKLIEDYEDLLETQKDQTEYAKKVADQQKEINKLEKQYRAIQNDNSEEGATKRQQLRDQINEKRQELQETQEDRRISETKDMLGDFEEKFEEFLENKLKNIEGIVREAINTTNENRDVIKDTINNVAKSYGYTPSDTLKAAINDMSNNLVSYFNGDFENPHVASIAEGVDAIVKYFLSAQNDSEQVAKNRIMADKIKQTGTHIQTYTDDNGNTKTGFFRDDGSLFEDYTGWAAKDGKTYRFNNGELMQGSQWVTVGGKKYHLDSSGARATGFRSLNGKMYYFDKSGVMQTGLTNINGKQFYFDKEGVQQTGLQTVGGARYYFNKDGTKATSAWRNVNGDLYYFDDKGKAVTGWIKDNKGNWRFFSPKTNKLVKAHWIHNNNITDKPVKGDYYVNNQGIRVVDGKRKTTKGYMTFDANGKWKGYKTGTKGVSRDDLYWTSEGNKPEAIIRKSDGAILTPLSKGDSVIPNSAMKNMYQALTDPAKYLKQYTTPDIKVVQSNTNNSNSQPPIVNMQFIANGVQDANKFVNDLMNNKKLEKWVQEITLGQANGNSNYKKYSYAIR